MRVTSTSEAYGSLTEVVAAAEGRLVAAEDYTSDEVATKISPAYELIAEPYRGLEVLRDMEDSGGAVEDLSPDQINYLRDLFEDESGMGLYCFTYYICGAQDLYYGLHFQICEFLSMWGKTYLKDGTVVERPLRDEDAEADVSYRRLHLCVPRDHFKTTVATRSNGLWVVTKNPENTLGIFNENESKAKSWVGATKAVITNSKLYHALWPHVLPPGVHWRDREKGITIPRTWKWGDTGIKLNRQSHMVAELTIEPFGIGGATAGKHFTHVIKDDIIGDKAADSEAVMQDAINWVDHSRALERPANNGCELVNYTRWHHYDVYRHMLDKWGDYQTYLRSMLENDKGEPDVVNGKVIFPTRFRTSDAKQMYIDDTFVFMSQYQCIPMAGRTTSFQTGWIRYGEVKEYGDDIQFHIHPEHYNSAIMHADLVGLEESAPNIIPLEWMDKAIFIDPAPSKPSERKAEPRARNALVVVGKDAWGRNYHLESVALREDPVTVLQEVVKLALKWQTFKVAIEEVCFSAIYAPLWTRIMYHEYPDIHFEWVPLKPAGQHKDSRILAMSPMLKEGFWYFNKPLSGYVVQELSEFPYGETKDIIDAMAYTERVLARGETPDERIVAHIYQTNMDRGRSRLTGY